MPTDARHHRIDYLELSTASESLLATSKDFYGKTFGWVYKDYGPQYADTQSSGLASGIAAQSSTLASTRVEPLPVIYSENLEASRAAVLEAGAKLTKDIFSFPGGRRFQFVDPAGNELAVWSDL